MEEIKKHDYYFYNNQMFLELGQLEAMNNVTSLLLFTPCMSSPCIDMFFGNSKDVSFGKGEKTEVDVLFKQRWN